MRNQSTILHRLELWASDQPEQVALCSKQADGSWKSITASEYWFKVNQVAIALKAQGLGRHERVLLYSNSCSEYVIFELGVMLAGGVAVGVHPHLNDSDLLAIIEQIRPKMIFVPSEQFFDRASSIQTQTTVSYFSEILNGQLSEQTLPIPEFLAGETQFIVFTSGTMGSPKGVMLGLTQLTYAADLISHEWNLPFMKGTLYSFLPLAHIAEKLQSVGIAISQRYTVWFNSHYELFFEELKEVRPTLFLAVPRIWERIKDRINQDKPRFLRGAATRIYLQLAKKNLGIDRIQVAVSGAAKLPPSVGLWFQSMGFIIQEIYGMSECAGVLSLTHGKRNSFESVGMPAIGLEYKLSSEGEIWLKGKNVFNGYWEDEALTKQTLLEDGWLKTGDLGEIRDDQLVIIGRNRDIIKLANGRMVAPLPIENVIKELSEVSNVCVLGEGKSGLLALVSLKEPLLMELRFQPGAIEGGSVEVESLKTKISNDINELYEAGKIHERIQDLIIISRDFSMDKGEVGATQKLSRDQVLKNFRHFIEFRLPEW